MAVNPNPSAGVDPNLVLITVKEGIELAQTLDGNVSWLIQQLTPSVSVYKRYLGTIRLGTPVTFVVDQIDDEATLDLPGWRDRGVIDGAPLHTVWTGRAPGRVLGSVTTINGGGHEWSVRCIATLPNGDQFMHLKDGGEDNLNFGRQRTYLFLFDVTP